MSLFSHRRCVLWPKKNSVEIFFDTKENNTFSFDINFWQPLTPENLAPLATFLRDNHLSSLSVLVPDDIVVTKSFVYDSLIQSVEKEEIAKLASDSISFDISPSSISYNLTPREDKTIIRSEIADPGKTQILNQNLSNLGIKVDRFETVSGAISRVISTFYSKEYFLLYSFVPGEFFLTLSSSDTVYLTSQLKKTALNIQKIINYSKLYFGHTVEKIFLPQSASSEIDSTTRLDKTFYDSVQIATTLHLPPNLPLPVLSSLLPPSPINADIIKPMTDNNTLPTPVSPSPKPKNILPIIAVFVVTAAVASILIWVVLSRNQSTVENPSTQAPPEVEVPTPAPVATLPPVDKKIKLQVLNATDINGQAATLKSTLLELGFTDVTVGNSNEKLTGNEIRLKPSLVTLQPSFEAELSPKFPASYSATLKETATYDAVLLIGTDLSSPLPVVSE